MKQTKDYIRISQLLAKEMSESMSAEDMEELKRWQEESGGHAQLIESIKKSGSLDEKKASYAQIDSNKAWEKLNAKLIAQEVVDKPRVLPIVLKIAAALLFPVAILSVLWMYDQPEEQLAEHKLETIMPGSDKAVLLLPDGTSWKLDSTVDSVLFSEGQTEIHNSNEQLIYHSNAGAKNTSMAEEWHKLIIPKGGTYHLVLADGTSVWLNSESELEYTKQLHSAVRLVKLKGEAYFDVSEDKNRPFVVETPKMDIRVYGTQFNIKAYKDDKVSEATLVEGSVGVKLKNEAVVLNEHMLKPDMQIRFQHGMTDGVIRNVKACNYAAWKDGIFRFNDEELSEILKTLARWYDVDVFYQNQSVKQIRFSGEMKRFDNLDTILKLMEIGSDVAFEINERTIIAREK